MTSYQAFINVLRRSGLQSSGGAPMRCGSACTRLEGPVEDAPLILNASSRSGEGLRIDTRCWRPNGQGGGSPFGNRYPIMYGQSQHGMGSAGDGGGGRMDRGTSCAISNTAAGPEL